MMDQNNIFVERMNRVKTTVALGTPDRVPFVPTMGNLVALEYGVSIKEAMTDQTTIIPALDRLLEDMKPTSFPRTRWISSSPSISTMRGKRLLLETISPIRWRIIPLWKMMSTMPS